MDLRRVVWTIGDRLGAFASGRLFFSVNYGTQYIRAVNYHATPAASVENFRQQLKFYRANFDNVTPNELEDCLTGRRSADKPGLLLSFDDGYRSNYDVAAPLLEEHGFTGWFFVSSGRMGSQAGASGRGLAAEEFMDFHQLRDLRARGHVIGCHTHSHVRLADELSTERLEDEIVASRGRLEAELASPIDVFCWVGGEEWSYGLRAARMILAANYRYAFMTNLNVLRQHSNRLWLDRTNIESDWPLTRVRFYLSGVMDVAYAAKRARLRKKLHFGIGNSNDP
jgi:peptidoglycan/xylan/chitin deacetylase (PgdA/CDA1 family)